MGVPMAMGWLGYHRLFNNPSWPDFLLSMLQGVMGNRTDAVIPLLLSGIGWGLHFLLPITRAYS